MKGREFTERKEHSEGNQVLSPFLWCLHQNHPTAAPGATPSATTPVPGLVLAVGSVTKVQLAGTPVLGVALGAQGDTELLLLPNRCSLAEVTAPRGDNCEPSCLDCSWGRFRLCPRNSPKHLKQLPAMGNSVPPLPPLDLSLAWRGAQWIEGGIVHPLSHTQDLARALRRDR